MNFFRTPEYRRILSKNHFKITALFVTVIASSSLQLIADTAPATFTSSTTVAACMSKNSSDLEFVLVGDPNNPPDIGPATAYHIPGLGSVSEAFAIAKNDVTASQYQKFLEAVESTDAHGLYRDGMGSDEAVKCITRTLAEDGIHYDYAVIKGRENFPITYVAWPDTIRFCNWLQNGQPTRENVTPETTETGAYTISSNDAGNITCDLQPDALYFLPTRNQWHKTAYYRHDIKTYWTYPTGCNMAPGNSLTPGCANEANYSVATYWGNPHCVKAAPYLTDIGTFANSAGPYGTFDMGGNVNQWTSDFDENGNAIALGGSWKSKYSNWISFINDLENISPGQSLDPSQGYNDVGFRIAGSAELALQTMVTDYPYQAGIDFSEIGKIAAENGAPEVLEWIGYAMSMDTTAGLLSFLALYTSVMSARIYYDMSCGDYTAAGILMTHMSTDLVWMSAPLFFSEEGIASFLSLVDQCFDKLGLDIIPSFATGTVNLIDELKDFIAESFVHAFNIVDNSVLEQLLNASSGLR